MAPLAPSKLSATGFTYLTSPTRVCVGGLSGGDVVGCEESVCVRECRCKTESQTADKQTGTARRSNCFWWALGFLCHGMPAVDGRADVLTFSQPPTHQACMKWMTLVSQQNMCFHGCLSTDVCLHYPVWMSPYVSVQDFASKHLAVVATLQ